MRPFQPAPEASRAHHIAHTLLQIVVFWSLFLGVLPAAFQWIESAAGIPAFTFEHQVVVGAMGFALASALGLWSAFTMATQGFGTPLPTQCARRLVVAGPYRYVRNPMAVAGLAQGACVAVAIGSFLTIVYVVAGFIVWNYVVRPMEEADLRRRFGAEYAQYSERVRCWVPRRPRD